MTNPDDVTVRIRQKLDQAEQAQRERHAAERAAVTKHLRQRVLVMAGVTVLGFAALILAAVLAVRDANPLYLAPLFLVVVFAQSYCMLVGMGRIR